MGASGGEVDLDGLVSAVHWNLLPWVLGGHSEESGTSEFGGISVQNHPIVARLWHGDAEADEGLGGVEVEKEHQWASAKGELASVLVEHQLLDERVFEQVVMDVQRLHCAAICCASSAWALAWRW